MHTNAFKMPLTGSYKSFELYSFNKTGDHLLLPTFSIMKEQESGLHQPKNLEKSHTNHKKVIKSHNKSHK